MLINWLKGKVNCLNIATQQKTLYLIALCHRLINDDDGDAIVVTPIKIGQISHDISNCVNVYHAKYSLSSMAIFLRPNSD